MSSDFVNNHQELYIKVFFISNLLLMAHLLFD